MTENDIKEIINGDTQKMVEEAEKKGEQLKEEGLTTSQIRNIFCAVKQMEMKGFDEKKLKLLKPKLAYAAARPGAKEGTIKLKNILTFAIDVVGDDEKKFENFCNFFEAILAYHRAAHENKEVFRQ